MAVTKLNVEIVKLLIEKGADTQAKNILGYTASGLLSGLSRDTDERIISCIKGYLDVYAEEIREWDKRVVISPKSENPRVVFPNSEKEPYFFTNGYANLYWWTDATNFYEPNVKQSEVEIRGNSQGRIGVVENNSTINIRDTAKVSIEKIGAGSNVTVSGTATLQVTDVEENVAFTISPRAKVIFTNSPPENVRNSISGNYEVLSEDNQEADNYAWCSSCSRSSI